MSIKDQLLAESKKITVESDALTKALEGVQISESVKGTLQEVFQSKVQSEAARLAESHIENMAAKSDELVQVAAAAMNEELIKTLDSYFDHLTEQFMEDNKVAIESGLKSNMAESLLATLKEAFASHNVVVPEESIDVVSEMESELTEALDKINDLLSANMELKESIQNRDREAIIAESIKDLTMVQQEQVQTLSEGLSFVDADTFKTRIGSLVEMVSQKVEPTNINENQEDKEKLNFKKEGDDEEGEKGKKDPDPKKTPKPKKSKIDESVEEYLRGW